MRATQARRAAVAFGWLVVAVSAIPAPRAFAAGSRLIILREQVGADPVIDRAEIRLAAELRAAGFQVEERASEGDADARRELEEPTNDEPFATVLLQRVGSSAATDVWVADHVTHKTVVRRISAQGSNENATRALALRVVELMRASLAEAIVLPAAQDEPSPPPDVVAWTREAIRTPPRQEPSAARVLLGAGIAAAFASPELGLAVGPELRVAWRGSDMWSVRAVAVGPAFGASIRGAEGIATVRQELALAELSLGRPIGGAVEAFAVVGAGAYHLDAQGNANAGYISTHDDTWSALGSAGGGALFRISRAAAIELDATALLALPRRPVVVFGSSDRVAAAMYPGALAGLTFTVGL